MKLNKKTIIITIFVFTLIVLAVSGYLLFTGPHMEDQAKYTTYEKMFIPPPEGTVPVKGYPSLPSISSTNPLPSTKENIERGKVYYDYYCVFCHGDDGKGDGPVGHSYVPRPADLHSKSILSYQDGKLYSAVLTGTGHSPVLERVVMPEHIWYVITYIHSFRADSTY